MNINQWYLVAQEFMSNYGGNNGYVRAYARYTYNNLELSFNLVKNHDLPEPV